MQLLYDIAMGLVNGNVPYIWGGKCPLVGLDCSGLNQYILSSVGLGPDRTLTADGQYRYWLQEGVKVEPQLGALAFFGTPEKISHTAFCVDARRMVEASGGSEHCTNRQVAALIGAYVRVSAISRRHDLVACLLPNYETIGL